MASAADTALTFAAPATKAGMFAALEATASHLASLGVAPRLCSRAAVLLEEALMNVVMHGKAADPAAGSPPGEVLMQVQTQVQMQVHVQLTETALLLRVQDNGRPFDPLQAPPPRQDTLKDETVQGGFGVHLMRKMASAMHYERQDGQNVLTLTLAR